MRISRLVIALVLSVFVYGRDSGHAIIRGTILDPSGAVIVKARILAINADTLEPFTAVVKDDGKFTDIELPPGKYEIRAGGAPCFVTDVRRVSLKAGQVLELSPKLKFTDKKEECKTVE